MAVAAPPPTPPRLTGDASVDLPALSQWLSDFYTATVRGGSRALDPNAQGDDSSFDPDNLPLPSNTNTGLAQRTANEAYSNAGAAYDLAQDAKTRAIDAKDTAVLAGSAAATAQNTANAALAKTSIATGTVSVLGSSTTANATFATPRPNTNYIVLVQAVSIVGSPTANAFIVRSLAKTTADFTLTFLGSPGTGNSIDFSYIVLPA